jgi:NAD(P)-dependent dehydrogenase (short-subunit alcohol dehydrogenase family)
MFMLDTNAFNRTLDGAVDPASLSSRGKLFVTHIQLNELRATRRSERLTDLLKSYPLGRAAHVQEVADLFVFLASPRSGYTSGTIITVDGGITSKRSIT